MSDLSKQYQSILATDSKVNWPALIGKAFVYYLSIASDAFLLMFTVALLGHPFGYLACLLFSYTAASLLSTGIFAGRSASTEMDATK